MDKAAVTKQQLVCDQTILELARLNALALSRADVVSIKAAVTTLFQSVAHIQTINTDQCAPLEFVHAATPFRYLRVDQGASTIDQTVFRQNAPVIINNFISVPKIVRDELKR